MQVERLAAIALKWSAMSRVLSQTLTWIVTLIVVRLLAPEDYGLMAMSTVVISIIAGVAEFGLGSALIQARTLERDGLARIAGALAFLNMGCAAVLLLAAPWLADAFRAPGLESIIRVSTFQLFLAAIEGVPQSLIKREMNFRMEAGIQLATVAAASAATLLLAYLQCGVWALVLGNLAGAAVRTILLLLLRGFVVPSFRLSGLGKHLRFGGQITAARFLWQLTYQIDTVVAARSLPHDAVGVYSVSMHLATLPMTKAMGVVNQVGFPAIARLQDDRPRLKARLLAALRLTALVAVPTMWGISAVSGEFVRLVLGEKWHAAIIPLQLLSLVAPARMLMAIFATATDGIGRTGLGFRNVVIGACILPMAFCIGVQWGLVGLALSWLAAIPLVLALSVPATCVALGLKGREVMRALKGPVLGGLAMYAVVSAVSFGLGHWHDLARLALLAATGATVYVLVVRTLDRDVWTDARRLLSAMRG